MDFCPEAMKRPHLEIVKAVMTSECPVKKLCEPSTRLLITTFAPRGYTKCVPLGCQWRPLGILPAR